MQTTDSRVLRAAEVREIYAQSATEPDVYEVDCAGLRILVHPRVFSPKYFNDSEWFAIEIARIANGKTFLDMGTGTGIIGLRAAIADPNIQIFAPAQVTSVDCNQDAVEITQQNYARYGISARVLQGDVYSSLHEEERFDVIFWNHPFNKGTRPNEEMLLRAGFDYQYESLEKYIRDGEKHLNPGGRLLLGTGDIAPLDEIETIAAGYGYYFELVKKQVCPMGPDSKNPNDFRIYELKKV